MLDIVLENGILIDPEKCTRRTGNLGVKDGRIAVISPTPLQGRQHLDIAGKFVAPGFIDIHGHVDLDDYAGELSLRQGITTTVGGNCGASPLDLEEFFAAHARHGFIVHQAEMIGHNSLRKDLGILDPLQPATPAELLQILQAVETAFEAGACGLSLGLAYAPGSSDEELFSLCRLAARYGRVVSIDTRLRTGNDMYSLVEAINLARQTGVRIQISHLVYQYGTGLVEEALALIDHARASGLDIRFDSGMYTQWTSRIGSFLFSEESMAETGWKFDDLIVITGKYNGQRLTEPIYRELRSQDPRAAVVVLTGIEEEIYTALHHPFAMPSTDIGAYAPGEGHPQIAGSFPRYFRQMVGERYELTLMEAVRKATLLPAETLGFHSKGRLRPGTDADLVVFDMKTLADRAAFGTPDLPPVGIDYVFLNGQLSLSQGTIIHRSAGRAVRCTKPVYDYQI